MTSLTDGSLPPGFDPEWQLFPKGHPRARLVELLHQAAVLRHGLEQQCDKPVPFDKSSPPSCEIRVHPLLNQIFEVDSRLEEWYEYYVIESDWLAEREPVDIHAEKRPLWAKELFVLPGAPKKMYAYRSILGALAANLCRTGRLWLNMTALQHLSQRAADATNSGEETVYYQSMIESTAAVIMELIEGICLSVPCLLQMKQHGQADDPSTPDEIYGYKGLITLWPLVSATVALALPSVQRQDKALRRAWIWCALTFLRNQLGIAKVEAYKPFTTLQLQTDSLKTSTISHPYRKVPSMKAWLPGNGTRVH